LKRHPSLKEEDEELLKLVSKLPPAVAGVLLMPPLFSK